jgi:hypothetical protein
MKNSKRIILKKAKTEKRGMRTNFQEGGIPFKTAGGMDVDTQGVLLTSLFYGFTIKPIRVVTRKILFVWGGSYYGTSDSQWDKYGGGAGRSEFGDAPKDGCVVAGGELSLDRADLPFRQSVAGKASAA